MTKTSLRAQKAEIRQDRDTLSTITPSTHNWNTVGLINTPCPLKPMGTVCY